MNLKDRIDGLYRNVRKTIALRCIKFRKSIDFTSNHDPFRINEGNKIIRWRRAEGRMTCEDTTRNVREKSPSLEKSRKTNKQREDTVKTGITESSM
jgi:hypothetical protein